LGYRIDVRLVKEESTRAQGRTSRWTGRGDKSRPAG
jgi:hypothetical protein